MFISNRSNRHFGITLVELIGVILSITAGLCIGANYMGLDLNRVAYIAMDETKVLRQIPEDWRPANPDCPNGDCPSEEEIREAKQANLENEFVALKSEVTRLNGKEIALDAGILSIQDENRKVIHEKTKQYWASLNSVLAEIEELDNQLDSPSRLGQSNRISDSNNSRALLIREQLFNYAHKAINSLDCKQVDPKVLSAAVRLSEWYSDSAKLVTQTVEMQRKSAVGDPPLFEKQAFAQAQMQHQKQTELVQRWMAETERYLHTEYGI